MTENNIVENKNNQQTELLIKNANIVDSSQNFKGDVYIKYGIISKVGLDLDEDCETLDAKGLTLIPSFVDMHVHFREPGYEYKEDIKSGSRSALRGGFSAVNLMGNTNPICSTRETLEYVLEKNRQANLIDIHQTVSMTRDFDGEDITHLEDMPECVKFISDDGKGVKNNKIMLDIMYKAKERDWTIISHAEDEDLTPCCTRLSENIITSRDIELAKYTGAKLHMAHVSTIEAIDYIIDAKKKNAKVTCEVAPHHIALTDTTNYRVNPPLRKQEDVDSIIEAIKNNYVDVIATDHAPHTVEDKEKGAPGLVGLETAFSVSYTSLVERGHIDLNRLTELMSKNPSALMGLNSGEIKIGQLGNLVLVDLDKKETINPEQFASKGKNTPFANMTFTGTIEKTIIKGEVRYSKEEN